MKVKKRVVNVIRHLAFEDLASFTSVLQAKKYEINYIDAGYDDLSQIDALSDELLVILGGPISVNDADIFPFLSVEIDLLKQRLAADKPTLGICLGAQLIASALGADIYQGEVKEIGWQELDLTVAGEQSALRYLSGQHCSMLHWHGETFDLPSSATLLASTESCPNQAFSYGNNILALQFHPEVTQHSMEKWYIGHIGEIMQTQNVSVEKLRQDAQQFANRLEVQGELFFNSWFNAVI
jgi:GMP synthase (glutamine-hydrolysing)